MIKPFNLATMARADKVNNYIQVNFYKNQLAALQTAVEKIGGAFVQRPHLDCLPPEVEEHLAFALTLARQAQLYPKYSSYESYVIAEKRLADGYAVELLREILAALDTLGLYLHVQPDTYTLEVIEVEKYKWALAAYEALLVPSPASEAEPTKDTEDSDASGAAIAFMLRFLADNEIPDVNLLGNRKYSPDA